MGRRSTSSDKSFSSMRRKGDAAPRTGAKSSGKRSPARR
jgi:hypothetical protein